MALIVIPWLQIYSGFVMKGTPIMSLSGDKQADGSDAFNTTSRYLDDILNINNVYFYNMVSQIYPSELKKCFCSVLCLLCLCARLFICALWSPAGKELTSWLSFVVSNCEFVTYPLVTWVMCGT